MESIRRAAGYRFPPFGRRVFRTLFQLLPPPANVEIVPGIRVDPDFGRHHARDVLAGRSL